MEIGTSGVFFEYIKIFYLFTVFKMKFVLALVCITLFVYNVKGDLNDMLDKAQSGIASGWDKTKEVAGDGWDKTKQAAGDGWDKTKEVASDGWDKTKELAGKAKESVGEAIDSSKDAIQKTGEKLGEKMGGSGSDVIHSMNILALSAIFLIFTQFF
jgi:hypothetical protein